MQLDTEWLDSLHNDQTETETSENNLVEQNTFESAERLPSNEMILIPLMKWLKRI